MALELSPKQAGEIADSTYALRLSDNMIDAAAGAASARGDFGIVDGQRLTGTTGAGPVPARPVLDISLSASRGLDKANA